MPLYMDVHEHLPDGATAADVAKAHEADLAKQGEYGVKYKRYWSTRRPERSSASWRLPMLRPLLESTRRLTGWWPITSMRSTRDSPDRRQAGETWFSSA